MKRRGRVVERRTVARRGGACVSRAPINVATLAVASNHRDPLAAPCRTRIRRRDPILSLSPCSFDRASPSERASPALRYVFYLHDGETTATTTTTRRERLADECASRQCRINLTLSICRTEVPAVISILSNSCTPASSAAGCQGDADPLDRWFLFLPEKSCRVPSIVSTMSRRSRDGYAHDSAWDSAFGSSGPR